LPNFIEKQKQPPRDMEIKKQEYQGPIRMANELNFINKKDIKFPH
jgi:hypothetical protein